jgi:hypothetical protein
LEYGGGHGTAEEGRYSSPRWDEGHMKLIYCDAPGFYLPLIVGQICWQWSNHDQPGSPPLKPHQPTLMILLIKLTHMCGQTLVKSTVKPHLNPRDLECFQNFCRVLQISPKHFKIYQYESCPVVWGT